MVPGLSTSSEKSFILEQVSLVSTRPREQCLFVCLIKMLILDLSVIVKIEPMHNSSYLYLAKTQI